MTSSSSELSVTSCCERGASLEGEAKKDLKLGNAAVREEREEHRHQLKSQLSLWPCLCSFAVAVFSSKCLFSKSVDMMGL